MMERAIVIGAGLAGCEAAWQLAQRGVPVTLHEMKPHALRLRTTARALLNWFAPIRSEATS